jgi:type IV fimbrial biogenesis protein FimT
MRIGHRGVTWIEQLAAIAVLATLACIALPDLRGLSERIRIDTAAGDIVDMLARTRGLALLHQHRAAACPSRDGDTCSTGIDWSGGWLVGLDTGGDNRPDPPWLETGRPRSASHAIVTWRGGHALPAFRSDGTARGSNITILICAERTATDIAIAVNIAGRIKRSAPTSAQIARCAQARSGKSPADS